MSCGVIGGWLPWNARTREGAPQSSDQRPATSGPVQGVAIPSNLVYAGYYAEGAGLERARMLDAKQRGGLESSSKQVGDWQRWSVGRHLPDEGGKQGTWETWKHLHARKHLPGSTYQMAGVEMLGRCLGWTCCSLWAGNTPEARKALPASTEINTPRG
jgi:hypothetical protein